MRGVDPEIVARMGDKERRLSLNESLETFAAVEGGPQWLSSADHR